jgi:hypothetical protein
MFVCAAGYTSHAWLSASTYTCTAYLQTQRISLSLGLLLRRELYCFACHASENEA